MSVFGAYSRYYDLLYRDKDYAAESGYVDGLIRQHAPAARTILELGCGTGAHAAGFAGLGYEVHGVDVSLGMLESARLRKENLEPKLAARLEFSSGDVRSFRSGRRFDVVTALFHVVSYQVTNESLHRTFATAAAHLAPGGIFVFDFWYGPAVLSDPPVVRVKRLEDAATRVLRVAEPTMHVNEDVVEVAYLVLVTDRATGHLEEISELHRMRYLFVPELRAYLGDAGLDVVHCSQWMSDAAPSAGSWNVVMVARAAERGED